MITNEDYEWKGVQRDSSWLKLLNQSKLKLDWSEELKPDCQCNLHVYILFIINNQTSSDIVLVLVSNNYKHISIIKNQLKPQIKFRLIFYPRCLLSSATKSRVGHDANEVTNQTALLLVCTFLHLHRLRRAVCGSISNLPVEIIVVCDVMRNSRSIVPQWLSSGCRILLVFYASKSCIHKASHLYIGCCLHGKNNEKPAGGVSYWPPPISGLHLDLDHAPVTFRDCICSGVTDKYKHLVTHTYTVKTIPAPAGNYLAMSHQLLHQIRLWA